MRILKYRCASEVSEDWNFSEIEFKKLTPSDSGLSAIAGVRRRRNR